MEKGSWTNTGIIALKKEGGTTPENETLNFWPETIISKGFQLILTRF